ncbi:cupin domain-containing protein [Alkalimarinus coralli]|uniref:cupin domain-containing protein n=1 Tax=Alkalimarinus coralli TaxID=2935863 RepID=UPI00202B52D9|nr:cupin domain-containing protein [Alkalimarinus coralli]
MINVLGSISAEEFLNEYWQKKPLLIRQAIPGFHSPISPDELAGLACEPDTESRIVIENHNGQPWHPLHGPFNETDFKQLPETHWTLLVQGLDAVVPEVSDLLNLFRFIPNWRIDDIMASYAPLHGSVGPHYDYYDVFLLQAQGKRQWLTGQHCDENSRRVEGTPLRILHEFETVNDWVLEPGDMLYLPPQIAHHGVSLGDCITLSIGLRSPSHEQILSAYTDHVCSMITKEHHLDDPNLKLQTNSGEINPDVITDIKNIISSYINEDSISDWFGQYSTEPKSEHIVEPLEETFDKEELRDYLSESGFIRWNEGSRFSYYQPNDKSGQIKLFYDGVEQQLCRADEPLIKLICGANQIPVKEISDKIVTGKQFDLLLELINGGHLYLEEA